MACIPPIGAMIAGNTPTAAPLDYETIPLQPLKKFFNIERFQSVNCPKDLRILFLLTLNQPIALIETELLAAEYAHVEMRGHLMACQRFIISKGYAVSPLILAVIYGRMDAVKSIVNSFYRLDPGRVRYWINGVLDEKGWNALCHAAVLPKSDIYIYLQMHAGDISFRTPNGLSVRRIHSLTHIEMAPYSLRNLYIQLPGNSLCPVRSVFTEFKSWAQFHQTYRDKPFLPPGDAQAMLQFREKIKVNSTLIELSYASYKNWKKQQPYLVIKEVTETAPRSTPLLGLYNHDRPIAIGETITIYSREIAPDKPTRDENLLHIVKPPQSDSDPRISRPSNCTIFLHQGWPNVVSVHLKDFAYQWIALDTIAPGEPLLSSTNSDSIGEELHSSSPLLGQLQMETFFKIGNVNSYISRWRGVKATFNSRQALLLKIAPPFVLTKLALEIRILFPLKQLKALLILHCKGIIHAREWLPHLRLLQTGSDEANPIHSWSVEETEAAWVARYLIMLILETEKAACGNTMLITSWVSDQLEMRPLAHIIQGLEQIRAHLLVNPLLSRNLSEWRSYLTEELQFHDDRELFDDEALVELYSYTIRAMAENNTPPTANFSTIVTRKLRLVQILEQLPPPPALLIDTYTAALLAQHVTDTYAAIKGLEYLTLNPWILRATRELNDKYKEELRNYSHPLAYQPLAATS